MNKPIDTAALLKATSNGVPPPMNFHVIGHLDRVALRWIAASPLMFAAFGEASGLGVTLGGGEAGFASADAYELRLPVALLDDPALAIAGQGFGSLFLLPCVGETMRVNGMVREVRDGEIRIAVEECYGHSDRALVRSEFWAALLEMLAPRGVRAFAAASRFMALATVDAAGRVELSPRDDPAGILARVVAGAAGFADRGAGFARAQSQIAAMLLVLGSGQVAHLSGTARIVAGRTAWTQFAFEDDTSALAAIVEDGTVEIDESPTLLRLDRRSRTAEAAMPFAWPIKREIGLGAELASAAVAVPGVHDLLRKGLESGHRDYLC